MTKLENQSRLPAGRLIVGTDTGVGKTYVSRLLLRAALRAGRRVAAYKPVCTGAVSTPTGLVWEDAEQLAAVFRDFGEPLTDVARIAPQRFVAPLAAPLAAAQEGVTVDERLLVAGAQFWQPWCDWLLVEGAGGLLSPISSAWHHGDLARALGYPVVVVGRSSLGTINHTLLTLEALASRGIPVAGFVMNQASAIADDPSVDLNGPEIERLSGVPMLFQVEYGQPDLPDPLDADTISALGWSGP